MMMIFVMPDIEVQGEFACPGGAMALRQFIPRAIIAE
jgi:hypothetical protein